MKTKKIVSFIAVLAVFFSFLAVPKADAAAKPFDYELIYQSPYPAVMNMGQVANVWIEVKNTGTVTWKGTGIENVVRLGSGSKYGASNQQRDYSSEFANGDWLSANRTTNIMHPEIKPGWNTRFQFNIKAPNTPGTYKAYFTPVVEGVEWMKDIGIYWQITVSGAAQQNQQQNQNQQQSGSDITVSSLSLTPNSAISVKSGTVYDFIAIANYSDGSTQNVTALTSWDVVYGTGTGTMHRDIPGRFIAGGMGDCYVTASFQGKSVQSGLVTVTGL